MVVHKYTGVARKRNRGFFIGGLESTPKEVLQNFLVGGQLPLAGGGSNPLTPPVKNNPGGDWCQTVADIL